MTVGNFRVVPGQETTEPWSWEGYRKRTIEEYETRKREHTPELEDEKPEAWGRYGKSYRGFVADISIAENGDVSGDEFVWECGAENKDAYVSRDQMCELAYDMLARWIRLLESLEGRTVYLD